MIFESNITGWANVNFQKMLLVVRHDKEMEQVTRHNERLQKALEDRQRADRARLPKWQRNDGKLKLFFEIGF